MKVLLVDAPFYCLQGSIPTANYPLGLAYISSYLEKEGHDTLYLNLDAGPIPSFNPLSIKAIRSEYEHYLNEVSGHSSHRAWQDFTETLNVFKPDVAGFSMPSTKVKSVMKLIEMAKAVNPAIYTVVGGHHPQIYAKEMLENDKNIDFVIMGEGEIAMAELCSRLEGPGPFQPEGIPGLAYRDAGANIKLNTARPFIEDIDSLPYPSFCYYKKGDDLVRHHKTAIIASRGCPYDCDYCATNNMWARRVRMRSPGNVTGEIKYTIANQRERYISFYDDCFTMNKKWLTEFCDIIIKDKIKINWDCQTSTNFLDEAVFRKIVEAGCVKVNVGIESGSERILRLVNKKVDFNIIRSLFSITKRYKIAVAVYIMVGFPTETEYDIRLTQKLIKELQPNWVYCSVLLPLPGTACYIRCVKDGIVDSANAWAGDPIKNIAMNLTNTLPDEEFYRLVDETFALCYKINTNVFNWLKRVPVASYLENPSAVFSDAKRLMQYLKKR